MAATHCAVRGTRCAQFLERPKIVPYDFRRTPDRCVPRGSEVRCPSGRESQNTKGPHDCVTLLCFGAAGGIRTPDHLVRSQVLYPTELRPRGEAKCTRIWAGIAESSPLLRGVERAAGPEARAWRAPLSLDPGLRRDDNEFEFR